MSQEQPPKQSGDFETSLSELEQLVNQMETGELSLEQSLQAFEKGVALTTHCHKILNEAEQKVEILSQHKEGATQPFTLEPEN